jgi:hypothetical protein
MTEVESAVCIASERPLHSLAKRPDDCIFARFNQLDVDAEVGPTEKAEIRPAL